MNKNYLYSDLTGLIIEQAYYVYNKLGYGFLEKVYERALLKKLRDIGLDAQNQVPVKVFFEDMLVGDFSADILVEEKVFVELKSQETLHPINEIQLVNYLKSTEVEVGLLINFGPQIQIKRRVFSNSYKSNLL
jgi:GxxExxY protein